MNTHTRLWLGITAGFVLGALFVGATFAVSSMMRSMHGGGYYTMAGYGPSAGYDPGFVEDMNSFMDSYRSSDGSIDFDRMHSDASRSQDYVPCG